MINKILTYIEKIKKHQTLISLALLITVISISISIFFVPSYFKSIDIRGFVLGGYIYGFLYLSPVIDNEKIGKIMYYSVFLFISFLILLLSLIGIFYKNIFFQILGMIFLFLSLSVFFIIGQKALCYLIQISKRISKNRKKKKTISTTVLLSSLISTLSVILSFIKLIVETFIKLTG